MFDSTLCLYQNAVRAEPKIRDTLEKIVREIGGTLIEKSSIKSLASIEEKLKRIKKMPSEIQQRKLDGFFDIIRYTYLVPSEQLNQQTKRMLKKLKLHRFLLVKYDDKFKKPDKLTHYRGRHLDLVTPDGQRLELQIHTLISYQTKMEMHVYYCMIRDGSYSKKEKRKALKIQRDRFDQVPLES